MSSRKNFCFLLLAIRNASQIRFRTGEEILVGGLRFGCIAQSSTPGDRFSVGAKSPSVTYLKDDLHRGKFEELMQS